MMIYSALSRGRAPIMFGLDVGCFNSCFVTAVLGCDVDTLGQHRRADTNPMRFLAEKPKGLAMLPNR